MSIGASLTSGEHRRNQAQRGGLHWDIRIEISRTTVISHGYGGPAPAAYSRSSIGAPGLPLIGSRSPAPLRGPLIAPEVYWTWSLVWRRSQVELVHLVRHGCQEGGQCGSGWGVSGDGDQAAFEGGFGDVPDREGGVVAGQGQGRQEGDGGRGADEFELDVGVVGAVPEVGLVAAEGAAGPDDHGVLAGALGGGGPDVGSQVGDRHGAPRLGEWMRGRQHDLQVLFEQKHEAESGRARAGVAVVLVADDEVDRAQA
uniref:FunU8 n=1 Tax=Streptosporangium sp. KD35 TaxID=2162663 RepID=A0A2U9KD52_9ACTN|nr:FunU8 [Streptosporangium sp. KD35]